MRTLRPHPPGRRRPFRLAGGVLLAPLVALLLAGGACRSLHLRAAGDPVQRDFAAARGAMGGGEFADAERGFVRLAAEHSDRREGREALLLLGILHLDPRNPAWDPDRGEDELQRYLHLDGPQEHRPEALAFFSLARRLRAPDPAADHGTAGGGGSPQGPIVVEGTTAAAPQVDVADENARLKKQLEAANRDNAKLREELERIRRTLAPPP